MRCDCIGILWDTDLGEISLQIRLNGIYQWLVSFILSNFNNTTYAILSHPLPMEYTNYITHLYISPKMQHLFYNVLTDDVAHAAQVSDWFHYYVFHFQGSVLQWRISRQVSVASNPVSCILTLHVCLVCMCILFFSIKEWMNGGVCECLSAEDGNARARNVLCFSPVGKYKFGIGD